jgi:hypothetical protein
MFIYSFFIICFEFHVAHMRPAVDDSAPRFLSYLLLYFFPSSLSCITKPRLHITSEVDHTAIPITVPMNRVIRLGRNKVSVCGAPGALVSVHGNSSYINVFREGQIYKQA